MHDFGVRIRGAPMTRSERVEVLSACALGLIILIIIIALP